MKLGCWLREEDCVEIEPDDEDAQAIINFAREKGISFSREEVEYITVKFPLGSDGTRHLPSGSYSVKGFPSEFACFLRCREEVEMAQA